MPQDIKDEFGFALNTAQDGGHPTHAKPMSGNLRGVTEIKANDSSGTYRMMYTAKLGDIIYVLHVFHKKSKSGIATPQQDLDLIEKRLREAKERHANQTQ
jgi:phage-related protein